MVGTNAHRTQDAIARLHDDPGDRVDALRALDPDDDTLLAQRTVFQALGHRDRLRMVAALTDGEKCACELQVVLDAPQSTVSTHLAKLRRAGLVERRRDGRWSHYRVADGAVSDLLGLAGGLSGGR